MWYVLKCRPKGERKAIDELRKAGIEAYCPEYKIERFNKRLKIRKVTTLCHFPRYVFAQLDGNDFGAIHSHKIVAARVAGNVLLMGLRFNNVRSETMTITYDPKTRALSFSPVELYMGD